MYKLFHDLSELEIKKRLTLPSIKQNQQIDYDIQRPPCDFFTKQPVIREL